MRRKLINQDAFDQIENKSAIKTEFELTEAETIVSKALGKGPIALRTFNESTVIYETTDNTYIHAGYEIKEGNLTLKNIEELVIDEASRKEKQKAILGEMFDAIVSEDRETAQSIFKNYLKQVRWPRGEQKSERFQESSRKTQLLEAVSQLGGPLQDLYVVAQNVLEYVDTMRNGPAIAETVSRKDDRGNVIHLQVPTNETKNSNRLQKFKWTTLNHENHQTRHSVPALIHNENFVKAIADLKRMNNFSDNDSLIESLNDIVKNFPQLLFVTQSELSSIIGEALKVAGATNFDDQTCDFMSEGILRQAHQFSTETVEKILSQAGAADRDRGEDEYAFFQSVAENFFNHLDEQYGLEKKAFEDLYNSTRFVYEQADKSNNLTLKREASAYLSELHDVLEGNIRPTLETAEATARWISKLVEGNVAGASNQWNVSNKPHLTVSGDHPQMATNAKVPAISGTHSGDYGDPAPTIGQDNHNYKGSKNSGEMRHRAWGQEGGGDIFPKLNNPYVPKPFGDYTMKGEKGVDKSNTDFSLHNSKDTWPSLQNPYVPSEAGGEGGSGHKMKNGSETDLVVDK